MTDTRPSVAPTIPITKPLIGPEEAAAVQQVLESGWLVQGPRVQEFEHQFAAYAGAAHGVAATSCTTALHLAVAALGLQPGDEVIVPAFAWISTANVVEYMGATPIFVNIDPVTFNIDVDQATAAVTDRTVGIIPVHLFGLCADMALVNQLATERRLWGAGGRRLRFRGKDRQPARRHVWRGRRIQLPSSQGHHDGRRRHAHDQRRSDREHGAQPSRSRRRSDRPGATRLVGRGRYFPALSAATASTSA